MVEGYNVKEMAEKIQAIKEAAIPLSVTIIMGNSPS